jgi:hypothetical protein
MTFLCAIVAALLMEVPAMANDGFADQKYRLRDGVVIVHRPVVNHTAADVNGLTKPESVTVRSGDEVLVWRGDGIVMPDTAVIVSVVGLRDGFAAAKVRRVPALRKSIVPNRAAIHGHIFGGHSMR